MNVHSQIRVFSTTRTRLLNLFTELALSFFTKERSWTGTPVQQSGKVLAECESATLVAKNRHTEQKSECDAVVAKIATRSSCHSSGEL